MTFEQIMKEITSGLTGEPEQDIKYLNEKCVEYKDHEYSKEILRACGRLMYECIPEDKKQKLNEAINKDQLGVAAAIDEANFNIYKGNLAKGEKILKDMVARVDAFPMFTDDSVSEYHTFAEPMQKLLYDFLEKPKKELRSAGEPFSELYLAYGSCLHEMGRYTEALEALEKALHWNPADVRILFEYGETWKRLGDLEKFFEVNKQAYRYAFRPKDVARCCRNAAHYFVEHQKWAPAIGYLLCSQQYDRENSAAGAELYYIQNTAGSAYREPSVKEMEAIAKKYDMPFGASETVVGLAFHIAKEFLKEGSYDAAEYYAQIADDLVGIRETNRLLAEIRAQKTPYTPVSLSKKIIGELNKLDRYVQRLYKNDPDIATEELIHCYVLTGKLYKQLCEMEGLPVLKDYDPGKYPRESYSFQFCCMMMNIDYAVENSEKLDILRRRDPDQLKKEIAGKEFVQLNSELAVDFSMETPEELRDEIPGMLKEIILRIKEIKKMA